jgi:hypothetical protein
MKRTGRWEEDFMAGKRRNETGAAAATAEDGNPSHKSISEEEDGATGFIAATESNGGRREESGDQTRRERTKNGVIKGRTDMPDGTARGTEPPRCAEPD